MNIEILAATFSTLIFVLIIEWIGLYIYFGPPKFMFFNDTNFQLENHEYYENTNMENKKETSTTDDDLDDFDVNDGTNPSAEKEPTPVESNVSTSSTWAFWQ